MSLFGFWADKMLRNNKLLRFLLFPVGAFLMVHPNWFPDMYTDDTARIIVFIIGFIAFCLPAWLREIK
jgi:hypothetical protein